ncbi:MAG: hypothetical protein E7546_05705 [Ruminococcaceae bacterium]|nr:hypothetical protein [Oscillospiraceae bacterium]
MKKLLVIFTLVITICLAGCTSTPAVSDDTPAASFEKSDIALTYDGVTVRPSDNVQTLLDKLGDDYECSEMTSCNYGENGMDKGFTYFGGDVVISTVPLDRNGDYINGIDVYADGWSTAASVGIGDSRDDIISAYGQPDSEEGGFMIYYVDPSDAASMSLYFTVENDTVTSIGFSAGH